MGVYAKHYNKRQTPQTEAIPGVSQVKNSAGGFVFPVDDWMQLRRFLILGCEGGTYYASEKSLTRENASCVERCLVADGPRTVATIVEVSEQGLAPKNSPAIFALGLACSCGVAATKTAALAALPKVARTGTHLFEFIDVVEGLRGWGRGLREAVSRWYTTKTPDSLAYQVTKYQSRGGRSHSDVLRQAHPSSRDESIQAVLRWIRYGWEGMGPMTVKRRIPGKEPMAKAYPAVTASLPDIINAFEQAKRATSAVEIVRLIRQYGLVRECIPTHFLNDVSVWEALLEHMPITAMVRNLAKMTSVGLLRPLSGATKKVADTVNDSEILRKGRVHPLFLLNAMKVYQQGHGDKGTLTWSPEGQIVEALNQAFYTAFQAVEPTGKRWLLALDISGSMACGALAGMPAITPREGSAAMALVTAAREQQHHIMGFGSYFRPLKITPRQQLTDVIKNISGLPFDRTDCSLPMVYAMENRLEVDAFVVYTDNETYAGSQHPVQALAEYRQRMGIPARLIVVGMTATQFSIADPHDAGMLDVVGFDASAPAVMADFVRGDV